MSTAEISKENQVVLGKLVCDAAKTFFENENNRRAFEDWYLATYGKTYIWKGEYQNG